MLVHEEDEFLICLCTTAALRPNQRHEAGGESAQYAIYDSLAIKSQIIHFTKPLDIPPELKYMLPNTFNFISWNQNGYVCFIPIEVIWTLDH